MAAVALLLNYNLVYSCESGHEKRNKEEEVVKVFLSLLSCPRKVGKRSTIAAAGSFFLSLLRRTRNVLILSLFLSSPFSWLVFLARLLFVFFLCELVAAAHSLLPCDLRK